MEGTSSVRGRNGSGFFVSFGSEMVAQGDVQYVRPLWGNVLIALVTGEIKDSTISQVSKANDRIVILDRSAAPVVSIEEPYETVESELHHIVQLSPDMIYMVAKNRYNEKHTQSVLFLKSDLPFMPQVKDQFTWREPENTEIKSSKKKGPFAPVKNPEVLWNREIDRGEPIFGRDRLYFLKRMKDAPDVFSAIDKWTGREILSYKIPGKTTTDQFINYNGYTVTDDTLVVGENNVLSFLQIDTGRLIKTVAMEDLEKKLNIPIARQFNYSTTGVLSYNNMVFFGKNFYESEGEEVYLLAFDSKGTVLWNYHRHVQTHSGDYDRNGRYRFVEFLDDKICFVKTNGCDMIDLLSGKYIEHKKLSNYELAPDLSGENQVFPTAVWQDKLKYDNYFKPKILHKDNNYLFVKALSRFWAIGEEALYDHLQRSHKLAGPAIDVNLPGKERATPLMRALQNHRVDIAAELFGAPGLNLDAVDEHGRTALYHAVALGDQKSVAVLLERKARTDTVTKDGKTLLHAAFEPKPGRLSSDPANIELVKLLAARKDIDINKEDGEGITPMVLAIEQDQPEIVKLFLARSDLDVNKRTAAGDYLNRAIRHSRLRYGYEIAMMLLDREEIDVNVPYYKGETLVHMGWYNSGMGKYGLDLAQKILSRRPDLNREDEYGETPLVHNINQNRPEMVRLLAGTKGVDLNRLIKGENRTPLGRARYINNAEIIDILQKAGAREFNFIGNEEKTPEGIPQTLLQNETASQAMIAYRGYLLETTGKTVKFLGDKKTDDAVQLQEFILDEILAEMGEFSMPKYSAEQRKRAIVTFTAIRDHYRNYPRSKSAWFKALPADKRAWYEQLDRTREEIINGKYDATPEGDMGKHPPMVPILMIRDYMARNSIKALVMMKNGRSAEAEGFLKDIMKKSDPTGSHKE